MPSKPAWDDLDDFLDVDDFASPVIITLADGTVLAPIVGQFEEPGVTVSLGRTFEQDDTRPTLHCKHADVLRVRRGDSLLIEGATYEAHRSPIPTGDGFAVIYLEVSL